MRKKTWVMAVLTAMLMVSACGGTNGETAKPANEAAAKSEVEAAASNNAAETAAEPEQENEAEAEPEPEVEPEAEQTAYAPGDTFTLGKWEITLDSYEMSQEVSSDLFTSSADDGNKFLVLNYTVTNNGTEADSFTAMFGGMNMKAYFKDKYEYGYTITMLDNDLSYGSVKPLASKSGFVVIEVPDTVAESTESLVVKLEQDGDKAQITLRP